MNITRSIETSYPIPVYNNSIISFHEPNAVKASIEINGLIFYITPRQPDVHFYFNFKEVVKVLMNPHLFADKSSIADGFVNDDYAFKKYSITVKTYNTSNAVMNTWNFNAKFLKSAQQIEESFVKRNILHDDFNGIYHFDIWEGLPFGITLFKNFYPFILEVRTPIKVSNIVIGPGRKPTPGTPQNWHWETKTFEIRDESETEKAVRFFFINNDGGLMQQSNPDNKLQLTVGKTSDLKIVYSDDYAAEGKIHYHKTCSGLYLKWFNILGGWDYFLFSDKFQVSPKIKSLGEVETGFDNFYQNFETENIQLVSGFVNDLGKTADVSFAIDESFLSEIQFNKVSRIVYSPKVCLWTGKKWIDVQLSSSMKYNNKKRYGKVEFDLTLPERILQTI